MYDLSVSASKYFTGEKTGLAFRALGSFLVRRLLLRLAAVGLVTTTRRMAMAITTAIRTIRRIVVTVRVGVT